MANSQARLGKPTLDKDLDKVTRVEEAAQFVSKSLVAPGIGLIFLVLAMLFAGVYVIDRPGAAVIVAAAAIAAYMAMNIGANDVANNVSPAVGSRAMTMGRALVMAAVFETAGALIAGGRVVETISEGIIAPDAVPTPAILIWVMLAALLAAALWVNLATWMGAPVSTTHTIVGGVMGAGIVAAGTTSVDWTGMAAIVASWVVSPLLGGVIAAASLFVIKELVIYRDDKIVAARTWVPVLVAVMTGSFVAYLVAIGLGNVMTIGLGTAFLIGLAAGTAAYAGAVPVVRAQSVGLENRNQSLRTLFRIPLIFSAALLSFAHGASDVSNAVGPLAAIVRAAQAADVTPGFDVPFWVMLIGALGISLGLLLYGPRLVALVGAQITKLNPMRAFCVALSTALTVLVAAALGLPVSTTHVAVGSVFGVGFFREWYTRHSKRRMDYIRRRGGRLDVDEAEEHNSEEMRRRYLVRRSHFMTIVAAWIITLPVTAALAAVLFFVLSGLFG